MIEEHRLSVQPRQLLGKKVSHLRRQGWIIGNIFQSNQPSLTIQIATSQFLDLYHQVGESSLWYLDMADQETPRPVLIDEVQINPVTQKVVHVNFRQVSLTEKVTGEVPLEFVNANEIVGAVIVEVSRQVEVEALPSDLPEKIRVDLSSLTEIGQSLSLADLVFDESKISLVLAEGQAPSQVPLVLVQEQKVEVEVEVEVAPAPTAEEIVAPTEPAAMATPPSTAESTDQTPSK